jgi:TolB-like protein
VVAVAALGWFASQQFWSGPPAQRIAIVPFSTLGGGEEVKAFASAVTDDLASVLSGNGRPIVTGDDAQALTGPGGADRIHRLGVRLIFGGTVAREADQLKVRVRLDDARQGVTLWTAALDGPAARSEQLQAQLGARIIAVLNCTSRALRPKGGLSDPDAMTLLLKACDIFEDQVGAGDDPQQIFALLDTSRQLTQKAPGFAAGHSLLAKFDAYYRNYLPPAMNEPLATEAKLEIDKALRIDPADIDAHVALYLLRPTSDFVGRDRAIMGASFDPSWAYGEIFRGAFLQDVGREQEGLVAYQRAVAANPLSADQDLVLPLTMTGQISEAKQELARISRLWPLPWIERFNLYQADHDWSGLQAFLDTPSQQPKILTAANIDRLKLVVTAARTRAPRDLARARTALMDLPPGAPIPLGDRVLQLSWLGFVDDAFSLANRASRDDLSPSNPPTVLFMPQALPMRQDRRFMALAARWGLVDYWTRTGKWPDFCSGPGLPYDCKSEAAKLAGKRS